MSKDNQFIVDGKIVYGKVHTADQLAQAFVLDLVPLNSDELAKLTAVGAPIAKKKDGTLIDHSSLGIPGTVFKMKRKVKTVDGKDLDPPKVLDGKLKEFKENLGNGSVVRVFGSVYDYTFAGKKGKGIGFDTVQVLQYVPFSGGTRATVVEGAFDSSTLNTDDTQTVINTKDSII